MAIYHCNCKVIGRGNGRSAVGAAAYRSGEKLTNEYDGMTHDYTNKGGVVYSGIMLCENAPKEWEDRSTLWNTVEKSEKDGRAQLAREYELALPRELSRVEQIQLARDFARENFVEKGMCVDFSIHDKGDGNPHAHIMVTMRPIDEHGRWEAKTEKVYLCKNAAGEEKGFTAAELKNHASGEWEKQLPYYKNGNPKSRPVYLTKKEAETDPKYKSYSRVKGKNDPKKQKEDRKNPTVEKWDSKEFLQDTREAWANSVNRELEKKNLPQRVDHRTLKEQGADRVATIHEGVAARGMEARRKEKGLGEEETPDRIKANREIKQVNAEIEKIDKEVEKTWREIGRVNADIQWQEVHENIASIEADVAHSTFDENVQMQALEKLSGAEVLAAQVADAQAQMNYHESTFYPVRGKRIPYLDYQSSKAKNDAAYLKEQISKNLAFIKSVPHYKEYTYGNVDVQSINETFRADVAPSGRATIAQRGEAEQAIIRDVKRTDRELYGLYDTTQLHRLITEQNEARKRNVPPQKREEFLIRQIQDSFANLRFIEQKKLYSYEQVKETVKGLEAKCDACLAKISEAKTMVERMETAVVAGEGVERIRQGRGNPKYMAEKYEADVKLVNSYLANPNGYNITDTASLNALKASIQTYRGKIGELQTALAGFSTELAAYNRCAATLERIAKGNDRVNVQEQKPTPQPSKTEPGRADLRQAAGAHPVPFDVPTVARQLEAYRAAFIEAKVQAAGRTFYQENPVYRQQAFQIAECSNFIKDYTASIESLKAEKGKLGLFHGKQKKELQGKIESFERLRREKETELKALGVTEPSKVEEAIKEKNAMAEQERRRAQVARAAADAPRRAEEAKAAYLELANTVPAELRPDVLSQMAQIRGKAEHGKAERGMGALERYKAGIAAERQLDAVLKPKQQERGEERQRNKNGRNHGE